MRIFPFLAVVSLLGAVLERPVLGDAATEADAAAKARAWIQKLRTSKDSRERQRASEALRRIGAPAAAPLLEALGNKNPKVRAEAAWAFGGMEQAIVARAVPELLKALKREKDERVLESLAKTIAHAREAAVPGLTDLVQTTTGDVQEMGFYALGRMGGAARAAVPTLIAILKEKDSKAREGAIYVLGQIGPDARSSIPALLKLRESSPRNRSAVIKTLGLIGQASRETLRVVLQALKDPDPGVRYSAVWACSAFGPKASAAVPDLIRLLEDRKVNNPDSYPQSVVNALGRIGPAAKVAGPKLVALLKTPDLEHATYAAAALLRIGIEEKAATAAFSRALDRSLQREKSHIRFRTFDVVEQLGPAAKPLVPLLRTIAQDKGDDNLIRREAVRILRVLDSKAANKSAKK